MEMGFPASKDPPGWSDGRECSEKAQGFRVMGGPKGVPTPVGVREVITVENERWDASKTKVQARSITAMGWE